MSAFGFDPSIILSALKSEQTPSINDTLQTLGGLATQRAQQQHAQAQLAELARRQQQETTLQDIYKQNADAPQNVPGALMRAGLGTQANEADDRLRAIQDSHRKLVSNLFYGTKDAPDYKSRVAVLASNPDPMVAVYAQHLPQEYDAAAVRGLVNMGIPAAEQAKDDAIASRLPGKIVAGADGTQYLADPRNPNAAATVLRNANGEAIRAPAKTRGRATSAATGGAPPKPASGVGGGSAPNPPPVKEKEWSAFAEDFDTAKGRSNLNAVAETARRRAQELETLLNSHGPMSPNKIREAISMAAQVANGGTKPTESQVEEMSMKTAGTDLAKTISYFTGSPEDAHVQGFIDQLKGQSERAKVMGNAQIMGSLLKKISKHPGVMRGRAEDATNRLKALGIEPDMYDPKTFEPLFDPEADAMKEAAFTPQEEEAAQWARAKGNRGSEKAKAILKHLGLQR